MGILSFRKKPQYSTLRSNRRREVSHLLIQQVNGPNNAFLGYAKTLSASGLFLATVNPKKIGSEFKINFPVPESDHTIRCNCKVVFVKPYRQTTDRDSGMALKFVDLNDKSKRKINTWVMEQFAKNS